MTREILYRKLQLKSRRLLHQYFTEPLHVGIWVRNDNTYSKYLISSIWKTVKVDVVTAERSLRSEAMCHDPILFRGKVVWRRASDNEKYWYAKGYTSVLMRTPPASEDW